MDSTIRTTILSAIEHSEAELRSIRDFLYENPEVGGEEEKAGALLIKTLKSHGFEVCEDFHGIAHAFRAVCDSGKPGPAIGLAAEYDALPGIGHGCGHNIIATAALGAAFGLQAVLPEIGGKVIVYGTPGEECLCTKVQLSEEGAFDEADVMMMMHPNIVNLSSDGTMAIDSWQVEFDGRSSHAGTQPEDGINALDAAVHFYSLIGFEKQYLKDTNIYGVFADGGEKCSVIPAHAAVKYLVRAKDVKTIRKIRQMFERCAEAAAKAVGATWRIWRNEPANADMRTNQAVSDVFNRFYAELGGGEMPHVFSGGSTDMADVSYRVPAIHPWVGMDCPQYQLHSKEFADLTITEAGDRALRLGASALALTGAELLTSPQLMAEVKAEFAALQAEVAAEMAAEG